MSVNNVPSFSTMTSRQLREYAKEHQVPGYSAYVKQGKAALAKFLSDYSVERDLSEQVAQTQEMVDATVQVVCEGCDRVYSSTEEVARILVRRYHNLLDALRTPAGWLTILFLLSALFFRLVVRTGELSVRAYRGWRAAALYTYYLGTQARQWKEEWYVNPPFIVRTPASVTAVLRKLPLRAR